MNEPTQSIELKILQIICSHKTGVSALFLSTKKGGKGVQKIRKLLHVHSSNHPLGGSTTGVIKFPGIKIYTHTHTRKLALNWTWAPYIVYVAHTLTRSTLARSGATPHLGMSKAFIQYGRKRKVLKTTVHASYSMKHLQCCMISRYH